jgi:hypothetical protein
MPLITTHPVVQRQHA